MAKTRILTASAVCLALLCLPPSLGSGQKIAANEVPAPSKCSADVDCKDKCADDGCPYCVDGFCENQACGKSCDADFECGGSCDACIGYQCGKSGGQPSHPAPQTPANSCGVSCESSVDCSNPGCPVCSSNSTCVNDVCGWDCRREEDCGGECSTCFESLCIPLSGRCGKACFFDLDCDGSCKLCGKSGTCEPVNPAPFPDTSPLSPFAPVPDTCGKGCFSSLDCVGKCDVCSAGLCIPGTNPCGKSCDSTEDCVDALKYQKGDGDMVEAENGPCVICTGEKKCSSNACGKPCKDETECGGKCDSCDYDTFKCTHTSAPAAPVAPEPDTCGHSCTANFDCSGSCYSCNAGICGKPNERV